MSFKIDLANSKLRARISDAIIADAEARRKRREPRAPLSKCCSAPLLVVGGSEGTQWYECMACHKPSDPVSSPAAGQPIPTPPPEPQKAVAVDPYTKEELLAAPNAMQTQWGCNKNGLGLTQQTILHRANYGHLFSDRAIFLVLPWPPSTNAYLRHIVINGRPRTILSREARAYKKLVAQVASKERIEPILGAVGMRLHVFRPMKRGDLANREKVLSDCLQGVCFKDDEQIEYLEMRRFEDKANPRVEVTLWGIKP